MTLETTMIDGMGGVHKASSVRTAGLDATCGTMAA